MTLPAQQNQPVTTPGQGSGDQQPQVAQTPEGAQQGVSQQGSDVSVADQLEAMRQKYEQDMSRLRSSLDRRYAQEKTTWDEERKGLLSRLDQVMVSSMDEEDRKAYEYERAQQTATQYEAELRKLREEAEAARSMMDYAKYFNQLGVPWEKLNFDNPEELMQSAWNGLQETIKSLRDETAALKARVDSGGQQQAPTTPQGQQQQRPQAQPTFTGKGTPPSAGDVLLQAQAALKQQYGREVSIDETFDHIEKGRIDINALLRAKGA